MLITKEIEIDMGHRVPNHKSKCRNIHGHRYKIIVGVDDKVITEEGSSDEGMVIDFSDLKQIMMNVIDNKYDHGFIVKDDDFLAQVLQTNFKGLKIIYVPFVPTAENLAKMWFLELLVQLYEKKIQLSFVQVYETPTSTATYMTHDYTKDYAKKI